MSLSLLKKTRKKLRLLYKENSYLVQQGYIKSLEEGAPCDAEGNPLPWMNYAIIHFLKNRLNKQMTVFEYGSGFSTLFFADRVRSITSVEHNNIWVDIMKDRIAEQTNASVYHVDLKKDNGSEEYCSFIKAREEKFDLVIIDGVNRNCCVDPAVESLSEGGVILFDDTESENYTDGLAALVEKGFKRLDFMAMKPITIEPSMSTILYKQNNCLGL